MINQHDIQGDTTVTPGLAAVLIREETIGSEQEAAVIEESMLRKLDRYVLNPLSLTARLAAGPWMMYANDEKEGLPAAWAPLMMTILNMLSFASDVLPASQKAITDRLKGHIVPAVAVATVFLMLGEQLSAEKKNPLVLAALGAFVLPAFAQIAAGEYLKEKFGAAYLLVSKALVMAAMVSFYMATQLQAVLLFLGDETYQTGRTLALAPKAKEDVAAPGSNIHSTFASAHSSRRESVVEVKPAAANEGTSLLSAITAAK